MMMIMDEEKERKTRFMDHLVHPHLSQEHNLYNITRKSKLELSSSSSSSSSSPTIQVNLMMMKQHADDDCVFE